jgi:hypothetical protein
MNTKIYITPLLVLWSCGHVEFTFCGSCKHIPNISHGSFLFYIVDLVYLHPSFGLLSLRWICCDK